MTLHSVDEDNLPPEKGIADDDDFVAVVDHQDYGYEQVESMAAPDSRRRRVARRNVLKVEEATYEVSYHPGRVLAYSPPRQRQKWGEVQSIPHVDWGDLFFDLHYVAATYNVSYILVKDPTWEGLLYAAGTFFSVQMIWTRANIRSSRFVTEDDLYHRALQVCTLVVLATAVLHIRPVKYMSHAAGEISMFVFCLCLCLEDFLEAMKSAEEYWFGVGQRDAIKNASRIALYNVGFSFLFHTAALIVAALEFFPRSAGYARRLAAAEDESTGYDSAAYEDTGYASGHEKSTTHVPIILILIGYWVMYLSLGIRIIYFFPKNGKHKEIMIPMNISFYIHRVGEWTLLMLGECVFSLVIVDVPDEDRDFYFTFYCSILAVVFLCYLHFQSQPHGLNYHALRRCKDAGVLWGYAVSVYSFALVCLGAAFTFFLTYYADKENAYRRLAGESSGSTSEESAHLFCGALAVIFACLDGMTILHLGLDEVSNRLGHEGKRNITGMAVLGLRFALIPFTATLSQWETDPGRLSMIGLLCVLGQVVTRKLGNIFFTHEKVEETPVSSQPASPAPRPRHFGQSVLMASAFANMSEGQLQTLEALASSELAAEECY